MHAALLRVVLLLLLSFLWLRQSSAKLVVVADIELVVCGIRAGGVL